MNMVNGSCRMNHVATTSSTIRIRYDTTIVSHGGHEVMRMFHGVSTPYVVVGHVGNGGCYRWRRT